MNDGYRSSLYVTKSINSYTLPEMPTSGEIRDGPLEKLWRGGGGGGIFEPQDFFFVIKFLVRIFFRP